MYIAYITYICHVYRNDYEINTIYIPYMYHIYAMYIPCISSYMYHMYIYKWHVYSMDTWTQGAPAQGRRSMLALPRRILPPLRDFDSRVSGFWLLVSGFWSLVFDLWVGVFGFGQTWTLGAPARGRAAIDDCIASTNTSDASTCRSGFGVWGGGFRVGGLRSGAKREGKSRLGSGIWRKSCGEGVSLSARYPCSTQIERLGSSIGRTR